MKRNYWRKIRCCGRDRQNSYHCEWKQFQEDHRQTETWKETTIELIVKNVMEIRKFFLSKWNVKKNYCWINCEWKYSHENLVVKRKHRNETSDEKEATAKGTTVESIVMKILLSDWNVEKKATVKEIVKSQLIMKIFLSNRYMEKKLLMKKNLLLEEIVKNHLTVNEKHCQKKLPNRNMEKKSS